VAPTPNLNFGADWFFTNINNMPGIDYNDMTIAEQKGIDPSQYGVIITRNSNGIIENVVAPLQNLSQEQIMGVDFTAGYTLGKFKLITEQNQNFFYKVEGFPGAGLENKLGWNGNPAWRNTTSLSYVINAKSDVSLTSHSIPHQQDLAKDGGYINPLTTFDIAYIYKTKSYGDFSVGVINILNSLPPYDLSNPTSMVNYSLYDPNGRQVVLGYRKAI
jgi:TonB dependent receptor